MPVWQRAIKANQVGRTEQSARCTNLDVPHEELGLAVALLDGTYPNAR